MQIHEGFPADTVVGPDGSKKDFLMRFDPQSLQMPDNYYDAISTRRTKIASSPPTYRFSFDVAQVAGKVGDYVAVKHLLNLAARIGVLKGNLKLFIRSLTGFALTQDSQAQQHLPGKLMYFHQQKVNF